MNSGDSIVNVCSTRVEAQNSVRQLRNAGFDSTKCLIEAAPASGKFLVVAHGTAREMTKARNLLGKVSVL